MYTNPEIKLEYSHHRNQEVVLIKFDYDKGLIDDVKKLGTDLRYIQEWLEHSSSKTTDIYTHVSDKDLKRFKNPIDDLIDDSG